MTRDHEPVAAVVALPRTNHDTAPSHVRELPQQHYRGTLSGALHQHMAGCGIALDRQRIQLTHLSGGDYEHDERFTVLARGARLNNATTHTRAGTCGHLS